MSRRQKGEKPPPKPKTPQKDRPQNQKGRKLGRPLGSGSILELTPDITGKICRAIRMGSHIDTACALNGAGYSTMREWILKAREHPDSLYGDFARAIEKAVAEAATIALATIDVHATGRPAEYLMEPVMRPLEKENTIVFGPNGQPIMVPVMTQKDGKEVPLMAVARDAEGNPIVKRDEVKSNWTAAAWKLERRFPLKWGRYDRSDADFPHLNPPDAPSKGQGSSAPTISPEEHDRKYRNMVQVIKTLEDLGDDPDSQD